MKYTGRTAAVAILICLTAMLSPGIAQADDDNAWTYWGDDVSASTGESSVTFDNGGVTPTSCLLTLRVKRYPDLPSSPGWLEPIADYRCDASRGVVSDVGLSVQSSDARDQAYRMFLSQNAGSIRLRATPQPGHHMCVTAAAQKNGSYTGSGIAMICGIA